MITNNYFCAIDGKTGDYIANVIKSYYYYISTWIMVLPKYTWISIQSY